MLWLDFFFLEFQARLPSVEVAGKFGCKFSTELADSVQKPLVRDMRTIKKTKPFRIFGIVQRR